MSQTKYSEIKEAFDDDENLFRKYETDCKNFIEMFQDKLANYLGCSSSKVRWLKWSKDAEEELPLKNTTMIKLTSNKRMLLHDDTFYSFIFRIIWNDFQWLDLPFFRVKLADKQFIVIVSGKELKFPKDGEEEINLLLEDTFNSAKQFLETEFGDFIRGKKPTLGFKRP